MKELLPCPFCGSTNVILRSQYEITGYGSTNQYAVCCDATQGGCGVTGGYSINENIAINKWNRRSKEVCDMNNNTINIVEIDGKQYKVVLEEITEEPKQEPKHRKTGYERAAKGRIYWFNNLNGKTGYSNDTTSQDEARYNTANYYTDEQLAKDNARADELMRRLRRFSAEHREKKIDWKDGERKWLIVHDRANVIKYIGANCLRELGSIHFQTEEAAQLAIDTFHDDLVWYFTEYEDTAEFRKV